MSLVRRLLGRQPEEVRDLDLSLDQWADYFNFNGTDYYPLMTMGGSSAQEPGSDFVGYAQGLYAANGIVFACMVTRMLLFAEARLQFQQLRKGRPGDLFGTPALQVLEAPSGPNASATTADLLSRMIQDADLAGNWYGRRVGDRIVRMRPDRMTILSGSETDSADDAVPVGYVYRPNGLDPVPYLPAQIAHFAPIPDPRFRYRGMSWLTPIVREIMADNMATSHKLKYWEQGASPNLVINMGEGIKTPEAFEVWKAKFGVEHEGLRNRYKTLFLGLGADAKVVGSNLKDANFAEVQAGGEARIAAAAGVPPIIVGLKPGLDAGSYNNYSQAVRRFADGTIRPLWRGAAGTLAQLVKPPSGARLWYDERDIAWLREDEKDQSEIQKTRAETIHSHITAGFEPDSVVHAVLNNDEDLLTHSGMYSVQLQPAGTVSEGKGSVVTGTAVPATTGTNSARMVPVRRERPNTRIAMVTFDVTWCVDWPLVDLPHLRFAPCEGQSVEIRKGDAIPEDHPMATEHQAMFRAARVETDREGPNPADSVTREIDKTGCTLLALLPDDQAS